jgi:hypothetical protein
MPEMTRKIYGPLDADLVTDIIRYSDGKVDPFDMANTQLRSFVERSVETVPTLWGDRIDEVAEKYAPDVFERWDREDERRSAEWRENNQPLVWKEISVSAGSEVRMAYGDKHHYAIIQRGHIVDNGNEYSPSEWASKVADNTSRNAWRDLWFKEPLSKAWVPAELMRDQARQEMQQRGEKTITSDNSNEGAGDNNAR